MRFEDFRIEFEGSLLSEGWRGRVYRGVWKGKEVAVKVAKTPVVSGAIKKEAYILSLLKGLKSFPQLLYSGEDFLVYEFIEGTPLRQVKMDRREERRVLREILRCAYLLDEKGISKDEFSYLDKNVLIGRQGEVYLIDFERGRITTRPTNVNQFMQLLRKKGYITQEEAMSMGKRYTSEPLRVYEELSERLK